MAKQPSQDLVQLLGAHDWAKGIRSFCEACKRQWAESGSGPVDG